jgi:hypothetical protein
LPVKRLHDPADLGGTVYYLMGIVPETLVHVMLAAGAFHLREIKRSFAWASRGLDGTQV